MSQRSDAATLVLVPNNAALQMCQAEHFVSNSRGAAIEAPRVDVFSLWVGTCLETNALLMGREVRGVPHHFQLLGVWEHVIAERSRDQWLPGDIAAVAREAMEADRLLMHWLEADGQGSVDVAGNEGLSAWRRMVVRLLDQHRWQGPTEQLRDFAELLEEEAPFPAALPATIMLRGFVELTRLERRILLGLERRGVTVVNETDTAAAAPSSGPVITHLHRYRSIEDELRGAAHWARERLAQGDRRVAVAINDLDGLRALVSRLFLQHFHPEHALAMEIPIDATFHLQGGQPLGEHPLAQEALELLALAVTGLQRPVPFPEISRFLLSPAWCAADDERAARAELELHLRRRRRNDWTLAALADEANAFECPILVERLVRLPAVTDSFTEITGAARRLFAWLQHWGWPGPNARGPMVQRIVDRVRQSLEALDVANLADEQQALAAFRGHLQTQRLPGAGGALSPIQITTPDDVVGQSFDAVRVVNVHADNWPAPVRLNRILPFAAARRLPRCDSSGQRDFSRRVIDGIQNAAGRIEFTWSEQVDGVTTAPSALIPGAVVPGEDAPPPVSVPAADAALAAWPDAGGASALELRDRLEKRPRNPAPMASVGDVPLDAAVSVLNLQAACPWAAFLVHRMAAVFPEPPSPFPDLAFTGTLVHEALCFLYGSHSGRGTLPTRPEVEGAVISALNARRAEWVLSPAALSVEQRRVADLLTEWLEFERTLSWPRPEVLETEREAVVAEFLVRVRMDRLDMLDDGVLILDYKTGNSPSPNWSDARPTDWQLPLYAVLAADDPNPVLGVGLLTVRSHAMQQQLWSGDQSLSGRGVTVMGEGRAPFSDWGSALMHWRGAACQLLDEFRRGVADFTVHHERPLAYCGLELLLRSEWAAMSGEVDRD